MGPRRLAEVGPADIEAVITDFRAWLEVRPAGAVAPVPERVDLFTLVGQFTALRHEVNLQTKAARAAVELAGEARRGPAADPDALARPLVKALIDIADALRLGLAEVEAARTRLAGPSPQPEKPGLFARLFGRDPSPAADADDGRASRALAGITDGYALSVRRADRALEAAGVEAVACVGRPFDPDVMEAVQVAAGDSPGMVQAEVRRGYRWRGALIRPAQVTVTR